MKGCCILHGGTYGCIWCPGMLWWFLIMDMDLLIYEGDVSSSRHSCTLFAVTQIISSKFTCLTRILSKLTVLQVPHYPQIPSYSYAGEDTIYGKTGGVRFCIKGYSEANEECPRGQGFTRCPCSCKGICCCHSRKYIISWLLNRF